jgi:beta-N-acetylhexosaminidase
MRVLVKNFLSIALCSVIIFSAYPKTVNAVDACAEDAIFFDHTAYDREECRKAINCSGNSVVTPGAATPNANLNDKILKLLTVRADAPDAINAAIEKKIGGVLVRSKNFSDPALLASIKNARDKGMMIATDGEPVGALSVMDNLGVPPPAKTGVELANLPEKTRQDYFEKVANKMKEVGISINYAPVADVKKPGLVGLEPSITNRIMGDDATEVAKVSGEFAAAMRSAGITPVFKHFPGHGSTPKNSDEGVTHNTQSLAYLEANDFVPYQKNLTGNSAVMVGNFYVDSIDSTQPAIFSTKVVQDTLRKKLNFGGIVVTDDLSAKGLAPASMGDRFVKALAAGADVLEFQGLDNVDVALTSIGEAITSGKITEAQLSDSYNRVASGNVTQSQQEQAASSLSGCSCGGGGDASLIGSDNAEKVWNYFTGAPHNFDTIHAASVIGNFMQEAGPALKVDSVNPKSGALGLAQWLGSRLAELKKDPDYLSLGAQLKFVTKELDTDEKPAENAFLKTTTVEEAVHIWRTRYERPGEAESNDPQRVRFAEAALAKFGGGSVTGGATGSSSCGGGASGVVLGSIVDTAINLALQEPTKGKTALGDATQAYQDKFKELAPPNVSPTDCGVFASIVMRSSGADPDFPPISTATMVNYVKTAKNANGNNKYQVIEDITDTSQLKDGDLMLYNNASTGDGHIMVFVGSKGGKYNIRDAGLTLHVPDSANVYFKDSKGNKFIVARLQ